MSKVQNEWQGNGTAWDGPKIVAESYPIFLVDFPGIGLRDWTPPLSEHRILETCGVWIAGLFGDATENGLLMDSSRFWFFHLYDAEKTCPICGPSQTNHCTQVTNDGEKQATRRIQDQKVVELFLV